MTETVAILGASINPNRFSHKAQLALAEYGHNPVPVNPKYDNIDGIQCYPNLVSFPGRIDTITIYVKSSILRAMTEEVIQVHPKRVIFNPGAECKDVSTRLKSAGIEVQNACTLVLLKTSQFISSSY
jgi:hypothetical protein